MLLKQFFLEELKRYSNVQMDCSVKLMSIESDGTDYHVICEDREYVAPFVLNATYAAVNNVLSKVKGIKTEQFALKYELCEIILCDVGESLKNV